MHPRSELSGLRALGVLALALLAACDLPTAAPKLEQRWAVPVARDRIVVADLLPASVQIVNGAFRVPLQHASASKRLYELCSPVCALSGVTAPKPAFTVDLPLTMTRPTDFASATLAGGDVVRVTLFHDFGFAVLSPEGATEPGSLDVVLALGKDIVRARVSGAAQPWASGTTLDIPLILPAGATLSSDVAVQVTIQSPAGDPVTIDGMSRLTASVDVGTVGISSVSATMAPQEVVSESVVLDLSGIDADVGSRAKSAVLTIAVTNPLDVTGSFTLAFNGSQGALIAPRTVGIRPGGSTSELAITRSELDALLGKRVSLALTGEVSATGAGGIVTIRPTDDIAIDARLALTVVLP